MTCKRVLIVEDEPDIRETLEEILRLEGFDVSTAANGREALAVLNETDHACLILLDLMMPIMDGWQFLEALKQQHQHVLASIPIVVVSAAADVSAVAQEYGCDIMKKPVNIETLLHIAREYCQRC